MKRKIIKNQAKCKRCQQIIESTGDFVLCECGESYVDGGTKYLLRGGPLIELSILQFDDGKIIDYSKGGKK